MNAFVMMDSNGVTHSVLILMNALMVITVVVTIQFAPILRDPMNAPVLTGTRPQKPWAVLDSLKDPLDALTLMNALMTTIMIAMNMLTV